MEKKMRIVLCMVLMLCLVIPATSFAKKGGEKPHVVTLKVTGTVLHGAIPDAGAMVSITGPNGEVLKTVKTNVLGRYTANGIKIAFSCPLPDPSDPYWKGKVTAISITGATAFKTFTTEVLLDCQKNPYPVHISKVDLVTAP